MLHRPGAILRSAPKGGRLAMSRGHATMRLSVNAGFMHDQVTRNLSAPATDDPRARDHCLSCFAKSSFALIEIMYSYKYVNLAYVMPGAPSSHAIRQKT